MGAETKAKPLITLPLIALVVLNLLTCFAPEIGFDALWYHLTLPKLWLLKNQWHFDGGLLYYSVMPRLTESIYIPLIKYTGTIGPKLVQFLSAIGTSILIFKTSRKLNLNYFWSLVAVSCFYGTWLVSWESSSAYIDLFRGFLEMLSLYQLLFGSWVIGGVFLGLAIGTKWLALGSLVIFCFIFCKKIVVPAVLVSLPWFLISYHFTGNPIFPVFSQVINNTFLGLGTLFWHLLFPHFYFTFPFDDFISPIIGVLFLLAILALFTQEKKVKTLASVGILGALSTLFIDPPSARFLIPYLPAIIIPAVSVVYSSPQKVKNIFLAMTVLSIFTVLSMRTYAFKKFIPFLTGQVSTEQFLTNNSSRLPDTFIDSDLYVTKNLSNNDKILIDKLHNLYYFPYNYDHTSWSSGLGYDYLITKDSMPFEVKGALLHQNQVGIQIFKLDK